MFKGSKTDPEEEGTAVDSNKTAKAKVVETDPYAYVYRSETAPTFDGITGREPAASLGEKSLFQIQLIRD